MGIKVLGPGVKKANRVKKRYISGKTIINAKGQDWFKVKFLHILTPITIIALCFLP